VMRGKKYAKSTADSRGNVERCFLNHLTNSALQFRLFLIDFASGKHPAAFFAPSFDKQYLKREKNQKSERRTMEATANLVTNWIHNYSSVDGDLAFVFFPGCEKVH